MTMYFSLKLFENFLRDILCKTFSNKVADLPGSDFIENNVLKNIFRTKGDHFKMIIFK